MLHIAPFRRCHNNGDCICEQPGNGAQSDRRRKPQTRATIIHTPAESHIQLKTHSSSSSNIRRVHIGCCIKCRFVSIVITVIRQTSSHLLHVHDLVVHNFRSHQIIRFLCVRFFFSVSLFVSSFWYAASWKYYKNLNASCK